jgi:ATP-dependent Lon protease
VAVGLAWTPAGGDVLFIEANKMKGKGTSHHRPARRRDEGIMQAALTWVRSNATSLGMDEDFFEGPSTCTFTCRPERSRRTVHRRV